MIYPEHGKLSSAYDDLRRIEEFLEWAEPRGIHLMRANSLGTYPADWDEIVFEWGCVDRDKLDEEHREMTRRAREDD